MHKVLDALPSIHYAQYIKTFKQIGCAGHSMGGYTCMGLAGAWDSWKREEVIAIALLSPWNKPYAVQNRIAKRCSHLINQIGQIIVISVAIADE